MSEINVIIQSIILSMFAVIIFLAGYLLRWFFASKRLKEAEEKSRELLDGARREATSLRKEVELQGKDMAIKIRKDFEQETKDRREELAVSEKRILQKEENLEKRVDLLEKKEKDINSRLFQLKEHEQKNERQSSELNRLISEEKQRLQRIASMSQEEAKRHLLSRVDEDLVHEKSLRIRKMEDEIKDTADKKSRYIVSAAIQRCASEHTSASTVTVVMLPSDEMKGRIIGREGRNIRALEAAAGVDIIIDDTPEAVTISGFDMYRREIAKIALETSNNKWAKEWSERTGHDIETILELGKISKNFVQKARKLEGRDVCLELDVQERDKYGRLLAYVFYDKKFLSEPTSPKGKNLMEHFYPRYDRCGKELVLLNAEILSVGRAQLMTIPPNVKYIELFELKNQEAKKFKRGIWKECGDDLWECPDGSFVGRIYPRCAFQSCRE